MRLVDKVLGRRELGTERTVKHRIGEVERVIDAVGDEARPVDLESFDLAEVSGIRHTLVQGVASVMKAISDALQFTNCALLPSVAVPGNPVVPGRCRSWFIGAVRLAERGVVAKDVVEDRRVASRGNLAINQDLEEVDAGADAAFANIRFPADAKVERLVVLRPDALGDSRAAERLEGGAEARVGRGREVDGAGLQFEGAICAVVRAIRRTDIEVVRYVVLASHRVDVADQVAAVIFLVPIVQREVEVIEHRQREFAVGGDRLRVVIERRDGGHDIDPARAEERAWMAVQPGVPTPGSTCAGLLMTARSGNTHGCVAMFSSSSVSSRVEERPSTCRHCVPSAQPISPPGSANRVSGIGAAEHSGEGAGFKFVFGNAVADHPVHQFGGVGIACRPARLSCPR